MKISKVKVGNAFFKHQCMVMHLCIENIIVYPFKKTYI